MILVAFALTVYQHYAPTTSTLPEALFREGENVVQVKVVDKDSKVFEVNSALVVRGGELLIPEGDREPSSEKPHLISSGKVPNAFLLRWDFDSYGSYTVSVNGQFAQKGRLVTLPALTDAAFQFAKIAFDIGLGLVSTMVLFLGLMKVGEDAGIVQMAARVFRPLIRFLFPDIPKDHPANGAVLMNITTAVLGLGNAATPFGLKAMIELQKINPHKNVASDSMVMLLGWNTAGFALLPTTLLAVRKSSGCSDPFEIIGTCMMAGAIATITAIVMVKLLGLLPFFRIEAALDEEPVAAPVPDEKGEAK
jgi:spore maturation protein A